LRVEHSGQLALTSKLRIFKQSKLTAVLYTDLPSDLNLRLEAS